MSWKEKKISDPLSTIGFTTAPSSWHLGFLLLLWTATTISHSLLDWYILVLYVALGLEPSYLLFLNHIRFPPSCSSCYYWTVTLLWVVLNCAWPIWDAYAESWPQCGLLKLVVSLVTLDDAHTWSATLLLFIRVVHESLTLVGFPSLICDLVVVHKSEMWLILLTSQTWSVTFLLFIRVGCDSYWLPNFDHELVDIH